MADSDDYPPSFKRKYDDGDERDRKSGFSPSPGNRVRKSGFSGPPPENYHERKSGFSAEPYDRDSGFSGPPPEEYDMKTGFSGPISEQHERRSGFSRPNHSERRMPQGREFERKTSFSSSPANDFDRRTGFSRGFLGVEHERRTGFSGPSAGSISPEYHERKTGFSRPAMNSSSSYNSMSHDTMNSIEMAKKKAEQIAARLISQDSKRPRTDDDTESHSMGKFESGFDRAAYEGGQIFNQHTSKSYGQNQGGNNHNMQSKKMEIPNSRVGVVIGKGGETIKYLQQQSGARIQITRDAEHDPAIATRQVEIMGTSDQILQAEQMIKDVIAEAEAGGPGSFHGGGSSGFSSSGDSIQMRVPTNKVGLIIGRGGETIKYLQSQSGARIQLAPAQMPDYGQERVITLVGTKQQTDMASQLIREVISENRSRTPHTQQGFRPPGPAKFGQSQGYNYPPPFTGPPCSDSQLDCSPANGDYGQQATAHPPQAQSFGGPTPEYSGQGYNQRPPAPSQGYYFHSNQTQGGYNQYPYESKGYGQQGSAPQQQLYGQSYNQSNAYDQTSSDQQSYGQPRLNYMQQNYGLRASSQLSEQRSMPQNPGYTAQPANQPGYGQQEQTKPDYEHGNNLHSGYVSQASEQDMSTHSTYAPGVPASGAVQTGYMQSGAMQPSYGTPYKQQGSYPVYGASQAESTVIPGPQGSFQANYSAQGSYVHSSSSQDYAYGQNSMQDHSDNGNMVHNQSQKGSQASKYAYNNIPKVQEPLGDQAGSIPNGSFDSSVLSSGVPTAQA